MSPVCLLGLLARDRTSLAATTLNAVVSIRAGLFYRGQRIVWRIDSALICTRRLRAVERPQLTLCVRLLDLLPQLSSHPCSSLPVGQVEAILSSNVSACSIEALVHSRRLNWPFVLPFSASFPCL